jgi:tRNA-splicing ligase RtcB
MRKPDKWEARARELCLEAGINPDSRVNQHFKHNGRPKSIPAWCAYRNAARKESDLAEQAIVSVVAPEQSDKYKNSPLKVYGSHEATTLEQMRNCMKFGNAVAGVLCADGHLGYSQPVGGVIAYEDQISISGVGYDIACGNMAVKLDLPFTAIEDKVGVIAKDIANTLSFGIGRKNEEKVEHPLFDDPNLWSESDMSHFKAKAEAQLGTIGSGNHYVDIMVDENGMVWIGVHFGSRGLGHTTATKYLKLAGGKDGINVAPTVLDDGSELGSRYISGMLLAGQYAYAGREWVVERVRKIVGGKVLDSVHNHHNYAWKEKHGDKNLWVVRKGATPAFPGQRGFVGGSMGDDGVIIEGIDDHDAKEALYSSIHGAGRTFGRNEAKRRFKKQEMNEWLQRRGVTLIGGDLDESPQAYRRLSEVLAQTKGIKISSVLKPVVVVMAGSAEFDPFKD